MSFEQVRINSCERKSTTKTNRIVEVLHRDPLGWDLRRRHAEGTLLLHKEKGGEGVREALVDAKRITSVPKYD